MCHRESRETGRGDLVKSIGYTGLLRNEVPRNDKKLHSPTGSNYLLFNLFFTYLLRDRWFDLWFRNRDLILPLL